MVKVVGISFSPGGRIYYFSPGKNKIKKEEHAIVETERGLQIGQAQTDIMDVEEDKVFMPLKDVIRVATKKDIEINNKNLIDANKALEFAKKLVEKENMDMKLFEATYTFDRKKLIFKFIA